MATAPTATEHLEQDQLKWQKVICGVCPAACWVEIGKDDKDKIAGIRPDPDHPLGVVCHRGEHAPEIVYSEHRLKTPLRRVGPKGTYEFEPISWDEAYEEIVANLNKLKQESGPESVSIYTGRGAFELSLCDMYQPAGVNVSSASNVLFPFGSPNTMGVGALCYVSFAVIAPHVTFGRFYTDLFWDIENAEFITVWGANPATDSPPIEMHRLEAAAQRGAEIVCIDPRRTETADRKGAKWIPIRPGSDGALELGILNVMIDEDRYDEDFCDNWVHGFEEFAQYVQHYRPEVVEQITGVPAETIVWLARRISSANGACPVMYTGLEYSNGGVQAIRAAFSVFALAGQLDVAGGIGLASPGSYFPINRSCNQPNPDIDRAVARDVFPIYSNYRGESHAKGLVDAVLNSDPYKIRGLIIHGASLTTSWPQSQVWRETLDALDFVVTIDRQMTADAKYADIILPATTMFEIDSYVTYGPVFRLREKVIEPVGQARNDYLIMAELAERLGYGNLYPQSEEAMIRQVLDGSGFSLEDVKANGGWVQIDTPMPEYRKWKKGKLRADGKNGFETPTGKYELWSTILEDYGYEPLPKYEEPREGPVASAHLLKDYPLVFNSGARTQTFFRSQHHGVKALAEEHPEPVVELNEQDAAERGIANGDLIEVRTQRGAVPFRALVSDRIVQGAIEANMGGGSPVGPEAWQKWNVNELTDWTNYDNISGFPIYKALLCDVVKVEDGAAGADGGPINAANREMVGTYSHGSPKDSVLQHSRAKSPGHTHAPDSALASPARISSPQSSKSIYLDNNATSDLAPEVYEAMRPYLERIHGNASAIHSRGREAHEALENARRQVAKLLHCRPRRIVFTGGGSEADNLALKGVVFARWPEKGHVITSAIEHPAIMQTAAFLEKIGVRVTYLPVDEHGMVQPDSLRDAIDNDTMLVSIMMANNEVGTIQPIAELCEIAHDAGALFHTDAVQAAGKIPIDIDELDVDLLTISAHKFHGPKGVGALYVRKGVELEPVVHGGKQEHGLRAGTENIAAIVGMGRAAELASQRLADMSKLDRLRDRLEKGLRERFPDAILNGHPTDRLPNTLNLILPGYRGESLVIALDRHGIALSSGSACKAGSPEPTHVLLAMGRSVEDAHCAVRVSLAEDATAEDIEAVLTAFDEVLDEMANTVRFLPCK